MAQLLVREISDRIVAELKKRAKRNGRSAEAEHRALLEDALKPSADDFWERADEIREQLRATGQKFTDSATLIRQARDER